MKASYLDFAPQEWSLDRVLEWRAGQTPGAPFLAFAGQPALSFVDAYTRALDIAWYLHRLGIRAGDRVATFAGNSDQAVLLWFGIDLLGAIDAPINPAFSGKPLEHAVNLVEAEVMIAEAGLLPVLAASAAAMPRLARILAHSAAEPLPAEIGGKPVTAFTPLREPRPADWQPPGAAHSDLCSILFTSGTTGPSKGVMVTHAQAFLTARQSVEGMRVTGDDIYYCAHPLFHMSPRFCAIYAALLTGAKVSLDLRFSAADWLRRVRECGATVSIGHGPLLEMIYAEPERPDDADTRLTRIGTSPFPKHIAVDFERRFGVKGIETWGMTEVNIPCWHPYDETLRPGSCGRIREEWYEFQVVDPETDQPLPPGQVGEFVLRPKLPWIVSPGYYANPQATLKAWRNLWFHSGDSGYIDADGWVYFADRLGDRIRRRAENISSYDIEVAANAHAAVLESAAIGVPSEFVSDDDVKLCVVLRPGAALQPLELLAFLAQCLPHHMVPRYIEILPAMPRTPTQKIMKVQLRAAGITADTWDRKAAGIELRSLMAKA